MSSTFCELFNSHFFLYISHELHGRRGQHLLNLHLYKAVSLFSSPSVWEEGAPHVWQGVRLSLAVHGHYNRLETPDRAKDVRRAHNRSKNFDQNRKQNPRRRGRAWDRWGANFPRETRKTPNRIKQQIRKPDLIFDENRDQNRTETATDNKTEVIWYKNRKPDLKKWLKRQNREGFFFRFAVLQS